MNITVTGGLGFIGSHVVDGLLDAGHETEWKAGPARVPDWRVQSLEEAALRLHASREAHYVAAA